MEEHTLLQARREQVETQPCPFLAFYAMTPGHRAAPSNALRATAQRAALAFCCRQPPLAATDSAGNLPHAGQLYSRRARISQRLRPSPAITPTALPSPE
ncbi:hypothetical protein, partial [uncultured Chloroflexus sp.]|uniref:hypothetical protein n=1 Tax=uncultured Chloroflexus sp. TaxID=214040 RepID=UPI00262B1262